MAQEKSKNKSADQNKNDQDAKSEKTASAKASDLGNSAKGQASASAASASQSKGEQTSPHGQKNAGQNTDDQDDTGPKNNDEQKVRPEVRRRTAGPARQRIAANDDTPSIGGLIYALQQRPSNKPFVVAAGVTAFWLTLTVFLSWTMLGPEIESAKGFWDFLARPTVLAVTGTIFIPIVLAWFLAMLTWRTQELRLMSSAMTEVAVRLAEPDRMSEQAVASLGQSVRRQVAAMNDGISRALGRASELETLVHNEVSALEGSYSDNELRIRTLIDELASEREAITNNSDRVSDAIRGVGSEVTRQIEAASVQASDKLIKVGKSLNEDLQINSDRTATLISENGNTLLQSLNTVSQRISTEVPGVIHQLGQEQARLTKLIEDAGQNLVSLQSSLSERTGRLEGSLGRQTQYLEKVLKDYTLTVDTTISDRAKALDAKLIEHTVAIGTTLDSRTQTFDANLSRHTQTLGAQAKAFDANLSRHAQSLGARTQDFDSKLGAHVKAIDHTLEQRASELDANLVMRTKAIDAAFSQRIKTIDNAISHSTNQIDQSFSAKARLLQQAMSNHGKALNEALSQQSSELDTTLLQGVNAIQKTSERITSQSIKTIEGLASQAEFLEDVSSGLLHKINSLTDRFEHQSTAIKSAAHQVELSNRKVDTVLEARHTSLNNLLENMTNKTDNLDRVVETYSSKLEASLGDAEVRALSIAEQIAEGTAKSSATVRRELEQLRDTADAQAEDTLLNLRNRFAQVGDEVNSQLATLSSKVEDSTTDMHARTSQAARDLDLTRMQLKDRLASLSTDVSATTQHIQSHTDQAALHIKKTQADLSKQVEAMSSQASQHVEQTQAELSQRVEIMSDQLGQTTRSIQERTDQAALDIQRSQQELNQRMAQMSEQLGDTTKSVRDRTEEAAIEIEQMRSKVYEQIDKLPQTARDGAQGMRAALQDQLKALDSLSTFAQQQAGTRDVSLPVPGPSSSQAAIEQHVAATNFPSRPAPSAPKNRLQDISQSLTQQMANRQQPAPVAPPTAPISVAASSAPVAGIPAADGVRWSLGDLLARASDDEIGHGASHIENMAHDGMVSEQHGEPGRGQGNGQGNGPGGMNFEHIAGAIDIVTAHQIWSRFRAGERGVLAREIYSEHGQITFDEIMRRYGQEPQFKASVDRYLVDYENLLREARTRDPKGKMVEKYLISETGRVYLLLAHASGRIA